MLFAKHDNADYLIKVNGVSYAGEIPNELTTVTLIIRDVDENLLTNTTISVNGESKTTDAEAKLFYTLEVGKPAYFGIVIDGENLYENYLLESVSKEMVVEITVNTPVSGSASWTTAGTYSFTVPTGVTKLALEVAGGGGASGSCTRDYISDGEDSYDVHYHNSAGGQGGLYVGIVSVTSGATYSVVVGAGGSTVSASGSNGATGQTGGAGGDSSFGSLATATGGKGGAGGRQSGGAGAAGTPVGAGGAGGSACTASDSSWSYGHSVAGKPGWVKLKYGMEVQGD